MMPPAIGPAIHTHQSVHVPVTSAGPNQRAGFMAAPVSGPQREHVDRDHEADREPGRLGERTTIVDDGREDRPHQEEGCDRLDQHRLARPRIRTSTLGVPPFTESNALRGEKVLQEEGAPRPRPASCATMYTALRTVGIFPVTHRAAWIAGLKTPPEMWTISETMMAIVRPWANAIARLIGVAGGDDRPRAEEDERERPDELSATAALPVPSTPPSLVPCASCSPER